MKLMCLLIIAAVIAITLCAQQSLAASPEPMPCVEGVCLGDRVESLGSIRWDDIPRTAARPITARQRQKVDTLYKGRLDDMAPVLFHGKFDGRVLRTLDRISAACGGNSLTGQFTSQGGNPTRVTLSLLPDASGRQSWQVIAINRTFPGTSSRRQQQEIQQQLDSRYGRYDMHRRSPKTGEASYLYSWAGMPTMVLNLNLPPPAIMATRFALNPQCNAPPGLRID